MAVLVHVLTVEIPGVAVERCAVRVLAEGERDAPRLLGVSEGGTQAANVAVPSTGQPPLRLPVSSSSVLVFTALGPSSAPVGMVVIPVGSLGTTGEVWNVWYAVDPWSGSWAPAQAGAKLQLLLQHDEGPNLKPQDFQERAVELAPPPRPDGADAPTRPGVRAPVPGAERRPSQERRSPSVPHVPPHAQQVVARSASPEQRVVKSTAERESFPHMLGFLERKERAVRLRDQQLEQASVLRQEEKQYAEQLQQRQVEAGVLHADVLSAARASLRQQEQRRREAEQRVAARKQDLAQQEQDEQQLRASCATLQRDLDQSRSAEVEALFAEARKLDEDAGESLRSRLVLQARAEDWLEKLRGLHAEQASTRRHHQQALDQVEAGVQEDQLLAQQLALALSDQKLALLELDARKVLRQDKLEKARRDLKTIEVQITAFRSMIAREHEHRRAVEAQYDVDGQRYRAPIDQLVKETRHIEDEGQKAEALLKEMQAEQAEAERVCRERQEQAVQRIRDRIQLPKSDQAGDKLRRLLVEAKDAKARLWSLLGDSQQVVKQHSDSLHELERAERQQEQSIAASQRDAGTLGLQTRLLHIRTAAVELALEQKCQEERELQPRLKLLAESRQKLKGGQQRVRESFAQRDQVTRDLDKLRNELDSLLSGKQTHTSGLERTVASRDHEIELLMYRIQELSSKYIPTRSDPIDVLMAKWINGYRPAVPFFRTGPGTYLFGKRSVSVKLMQDKPLLRGTPGGPFVEFPQFLEKYAAEELEGLLDPPGRR